MSFLQIQNLARRYGETTVFDRVNFSMEKGEFVAIIGHSGCGKTTILNILAGLDTASDGVVVMDGREVAGPSMCLPSSRMVPEVGRSSPATRFSSVVLPQPEWPMSVTNSPLRMRTSKFSTMTAGPRGLA